MRIKNTEVYGFKPALRGMRNPLESWHLSDSYRAFSIDEAITKPEYEHNAEMFVLGEVDLDLCQRLVKAGSADRKFLRQIIVWVDLTLPRYIWQEFDTYKYHSTNSCSTMHTAHRRHLTPEDFDCPEEVSPVTLAELNELITMKMNKELTRKEFIHKFKRKLPEDFMQKRTVCTSYEELLSMLNQRDNHTLDIWHVILDNMTKPLPYFKAMTSHVWRFPQKDTE